MTVGNSCNIIFRSGKKLFDKTVAPLLYLAGCEVTVIKVSIISCLDVPFIALYSLTRDSRLHTADLTITSLI